MVIPVLSSDGPKNAARPGRRLSVMAMFAGMILRNYG